MNYTPNHHLPQWVKSDRIRMEDFNQMNKDIEAGLDAAGSKANAAQSAAQAAQSAAAAKPYAVGTYTGTGALQSIHLGFKPSLVIISGATAAMSPDSFDAMLFMGMTGGETLKNRCAFTATGFNVYASSTISPSYPYLNEEGRTYEYIAFK